MYTKRKIPNYWISLLLDDDSEDDRAKPGLLNVYY